MQIKISDHFTLGRLFRYTAPTCVMMVFTSIYGVVDGLFVSNFVGKEPFAALNLIYPMFMMLGSLGFMFGAGGTALVAKTMGAGDDERARGVLVCRVRDARRWCRVRRDCARYRAARRRGVRRDGKLA